MINDRGITKWQMAFALPELTKELNNYWLETEKVGQPILDEQKIEEINDVVAIALEEYSLVSIEIYKNGFINELIGYINKVDINTQSLKVSDKKEYKHSVRFKDIVDIRLV